MESMFNNAKEEPRQLGDLTEAEGRLFEEWASAPQEESSAASGIARLLQALKAVRAERDALAEKLAIAEQKIAARETVLVRAEVVR